MRSRTGWELEEILVNALLEYTLFGWSKRCNCNFYRFFLLSWNNTINTRQYYNNTCPLLLWATRYFILIYTFIDPYKLVRQRCIAHRLFLKYLNYIWQRSWIYNKKPCLDLKFFVKERCQHEKISSAVWIYCFSFSW